MATVTFDTASGLPVAMDVAVRPFIPVELHFKDLEIEKIKDPKVRDLCIDLVNCLQGSMILNYMDRDDDKIRDKTRDTMFSLKMLRTDAQEAIPTLQTIAQSQITEITVRVNALDALRMINEEFAVVSLKSILTNNKSPHIWQELEGVFYKLSDSGRTALMPEIDAAAQNMDEVSNNLTTVRAIARRMLDKVPVNTFEI